MSSKKPGGSLERPRGMIQSIGRHSSHSQAAVVSLLLLCGAAHSVGAFPRANVPYSSMRLRGGLGQDSSGPGSGWPGGGAPGGMGGIPPHGSFAGLGDEGVTAEEMAEIQSSVLKMYEVSIAETKRHEQELRSVSLEVALWFCGHVWPWCRADRVRERMRA